MRFAKVSIVALIIFSTLAAGSGVFLQAQSEDGRKRGRRPDAEDSTTPTATKNKGPQKYIAISKETTYFTEPLDDRGYVNYLAAINKLLKPDGLTRENNGYVLLWQALGHAEGNAEWVQEMAEELGVEPLPIEGDYIVNIGQYAQRKKVAMGENTDLEEFAKLQNKIFDQQGETAEKPWKAAEYPMMVEWIKLNEKPLKLVKQATEKPLYYRPYVGKDEDGNPGMLIAILLPDVQSFRAIARVLAARAMLNLGEGNTKAAQQDLLTMHKLARMCTKNLTLIEQLVGIAIEAIALTGDRQIALHGNLAADELLDYRKQLEALSTISDMHRSINVGERTMGLDSIVHLARGNVGDSKTNGADLMNGLIGLPSSESGIMKAWFALSFNWNEVLLISNEWYDRLGTISALPRPQRIKESEKLEQDLMKIKKDITSPTGMAKALLLGPKQRGKVMAQIVMSLLLPATHRAVDAQDRSLMTKDITLLAFSLQAYHKENGAYPKSLAELSPKYAVKIPQDVFAQAPLKYTSDGKTFTLYSIGHNETDDGGKTYGDHIDDRRTDDIVVKSPETK